MSGTDVIVLYIDFGNRATIPRTKCGVLPASFSALPAFAKEYALAFMSLPPDVSQMLQIQKLTFLLIFNIFQEDYAQSGLQALKDDLLDRKVKINVEYKFGTQDYVTVFDTATNDDIGKNIVLDGLMLVDKKGGRRLAKMVNAYIEAQDSAKRNHLNIWEYGDITGEEAREFGAPPPKA